MMSIVQEAKEAKEVKIDQEKEEETLGQRMDVAGFLVYRPIKKHFYMPLATKFINRWEKERQFEVEAINMNHPNVKQYVAEKV